MSQPTRAERRRQTRGSGPNDPPPHRDPMVAVYVGVAILIAAVFAIFGIMKWSENRAIAQANATPTPGPNASAKPIALIDGGTLGAKRFPEANTPAGGTGQPVDGITCISQEGQVLHVHSQLTILDHGKQVQIPRFIGFAPNKTVPTSGCLYWIHTHDSSGIIHVEAPELHPPGGGPYTLGMLFDIWGQPLTGTDVAGIKGPVTAFVNGAKYDGDLHAIPLGSHQQITLEVGNPVTPAPLYSFPPND